MDLQDRLDDVRNRMRKAAVEARREQDEDRAEAGAVSEA